MSGAGLPQGFVVDPAPPVGFQIDSTPPAPANDSGGGWRNFRAGATEAVTSLGNMMGAPLVAKTFNDVSGGFGGPTIPMQYVPGSTEQANRVLGLAGLNPEDVHANTFGEHLARGAGGGVMAAFAPEAEGLTVARMLSNAAIGTASGTSAAAASEAAPEPLKPLASLLGGFLGGMTAYGAGRVGSAAARAARGATEPFAAAVSPKAAERQAGAVINSRAANPQTVADMLAGGATETVPGSKPTTFQQTGDVGLGALEREVAARNPQDFATRRGEQNAARLGSLTGIQAGGNPAAVSDFLGKTLQAVDLATAHHVDNLVTTARSQVEALGGRATPEAYGEATRAALADAENSARASERGLWQAIDPKGDLTGNVSATRTAASDIVKELPSTAKPMAGEEAAIFQAAREMPRIAPVGDLIALRSRVSTEMRNELIANGRSPTYARLTRLRGAIQNNLASSIADHIVDEAPAGIGHNSGIAGRIQGWIDAYRQRQSAETGTGGPTSLAGPADTGATSLVVPDGAGLSPPGGPGSLGGGSRLPSNAPTFDADAKARLAAATDATRARARTFGLAPVSTILNKAGASDLFRLPEARVPEKFFHPGPTGYTDMQALFNAIGQDKALPIIQDYAASTLRRTAMRDDGTLDPKKFAVWQKGNSESLRALPPDVQANFANAGAASRAIENATRDRETAMEAAQSGALGRLIGAQAPEDVTRVIGSILGSRTAVSEMRVLAKATANNDLARQGLRQAIADHITSKLISNTEAGASGQDLIKADAFQTFMRQNRAALSTVFSPKEIANMETVAADIKQAKRSENAVRLPGGSNTAQDVYGMVRNSRQTPSYLKAIIDIAGAGAGSVFGGPVGAFIAGIGAHALQEMRAAGIDRVDQLVTRAMLDPDIARELRRKVPPPKSGIQSGLPRALRTSLAVSTLRAAATARAQQRAH